MNQYYYDVNGNVIVDSVKQNYYIKYDWRNLITELRHWRFAPGGGDEGVGGGGQEIWVYKANYWYDEAGNRICKKTFIWQPSGQIEPGIGSIGQIIEEGDNPTGTWQAIETICYLRDVAGKEIAIYNGNSIDQWNLYGLDNVGAVKSNGDKQFYLKDHLGSIRAILDSTNTVVQAFDYDCWGYPLEYRSYEPVNQRYKFTSKELDKESSIDGNGYDYFGARYYDSRIGNWLSIDPLMEKHYDYTPYNYVLRNPIYYFDPDGKQMAAVLSKTVETVAGFLGIPLGPIGIIANFIFSPEQFANAELYDKYGFKVGEEGYLEYLYPTEEIVVTALKSEGGIYIPEEGKIPLEELNPPEERGLAPTSKETGKPIEIHHIGQKKGGPYEERHRQEHRTEGSYKKFHDPKKKSEREKNWSEMVRKYWKQKWDRGRFEK